jgi:ABC-type glutathione transport system ATPase component
MLLQVLNLKQVERAGGQGPARAVFDGLNLELAPGERVAVVALPGELPTALARTLALLHRPASGQILFEGNDVTRAGGGKLRALRRSLQYVGGEGRRALAPRLPLANVLAEPLNVHKLGGPDERRAKVAAAAHTWELNTHLLQFPASALSGALCQRVALARACLLEPRLLIADQITQRLEPAAAAPLVARLAAHCQAAAMACLLLTPDPALARNFGQRQLRLHPNGQLRPA